MKQFKHHSATLQDCRSRNNSQRGFAADGFAGTAFEKVVGNNDRCATVLLQDGEDVLEEVEL